MRTRSIPLAVALALVIGLFSATPASAAIDASVSFLHEDFHLYSPFSGPARIRLTWGSNDPDADLTFRLRRGGSVIHTDPYHLVTPGAGAKTVDFDWPAESVNEPTNYQVTVHRGSTQLASRTFELLPRLVRITSIRPDPFFPRIKDGYRDITTVRFHLEATSNPTIVRIYRANAQGECCGKRVRREDLDDQVVGNRTYEWNGRGEGIVQPVGDYFVRITATKQSSPTDVTRTSRPFEVTIARYHRVFKRIGKHGIAFHHRSPDTVLRAGGRCRLARDFATKDLWIRCNDARVTVFWRWSLQGRKPRIETVGFNMIRVPGFRCRLTKGHTTVDSFMRVGAVGQRRCRVDRARITYSYLKAS